MKEYRVLADKYDNEKEMFQKVMMRSDENDQLKLLEDKSRENIKLKLQIQ